LEHVPNISRQDAIRALLSVDDDVGAAVDRLFELKGIKGPDGMAELSQRQARKMRLVRKKVERLYDKVERERIRRQAKVEKLQKLNEAQADAPQDEADVDATASRMAQTLDI